MKSWSESKICFPNGSRHNILPELKIIDLIISHIELYRIYSYGFYITKYSLRCTMHKNVIYLVRKTIYGCSSHHQVFQFWEPLNSTRNCHTMSGIIWLDEINLWIRFTCYGITNLLLTSNNFVIPCVTSGVLIQPIKPPFCKVLYGTRTDNLMSGFYLMLWALSVWHEIVWT